MNTKLKREAKNNFEKDFFKLMNNAVFGKTIEKVRKDRYFKLVTTDKRRNQSSSEPNCHTTIYFSENLLGVEMKKTKVKMIKPVYLNMSILEISKTLMYELWYDYIKRKYQDKAKVCYMDTDSFIIHIKTENLYEHIASDVEKRFHTSNYSEDDKRLLPIRKSKKKICFFRDELGGKIMKQFAGLRAKTYSYLMDDDSENKKVEKTKNCVIKTILKRY